MRKSGGTTKRSAAGDWSTPPNRSAPRTAPSTPATLTRRDGSFPLPSYSQASYATFCRQIARIPELVKVMARRGEDAYRNHELISFRDYSSIMPMDYVVMDHRVLDIFCLVRDGGRVEADAAVADGGDRHAHAEMAGMGDRRDAVERFDRGRTEARVHRPRLAEGLYWDNGKDFRCEWLEGEAGKARQSGKMDGSGEELDAACWSTLDMRVHHAIVYNARAKMIEPNFGPDRRFRPDAAGMVRAQARRAAGTIRRAAQGARGVAEGEARIDAVPDDPGDRGAVIGGDRGPERARAWRRGHAEGHSDGLDGCARTRPGRS